jgi:hypothetical protein
MALGLFDSIRTSLFSKMFPATGPSGDVEKSVVDAIDVVEEQEPILLLAEPVDPVDPVEPADPLDDVKPVGLQILT